MMDDTNGYSDSVQFELSEEQVRRNIPLHELGAHIEKLQDPFDASQSDINGFDVEFNYIENKTAQDLFFGDYKSAIKPINKLKNRYSNVLPPEKTRVQLNAETEEEGADYINANYVNGLIPGSERAYIATQGPLQTTFADFWRMVWELNTVVIIMLTKEVENGRWKCDRYWPDMDCPLTVGYFRISLKTMQETNELTTRVLELFNCDENATKEVHQFQYTAWPDHGLPVSTTAFLDLAHSVDEANTTKGPMIVHCSAGIGRSGTFCAVHSTIEKFKLDLENEPTVEPTVSLVNTVLYMRQQRPGMVQTREQFMFCYLAIKEEAERLYQKKKSELLLAKENGNKN